MTEKIQVPDTVRRQITEQKIQMWRNTLYSAELDARIAKVLDKPKGEAQAAKLMKDALQAIDVLEGLLNDIPKEGEGNGTNLESD